MVKDVFVIGAGCSVPYGFPTGRDLMQKLKNFNYGETNIDDQSYLPPSYIFDIYNESFGKYQDYIRWKKADGQSAALAENLEIEICNKIKKVIYPFATSIQDSMMVSTDEFLKNRFFQKKDEQVDFGKRLIAYEILKTEYVSRKQPSASVGESKGKWLGSIDWLQHLLSLIDQRTNWEEILKESVFLTFNYDRVLESCLYRYLISDKQCSADDAHAFIHQMNIYHVNGYIGPLDEISYGWGINGQYDQIASRMKTVWEKTNSTDQSEIETYKECLQKADRVFFLGFSYIPGNLKSIGIEKGAEIIRDAKVYATAMGLSPQNRLRVASYLNINEFEKRKEIEEYDDNRILKDASAESLILDYYTFD